MALRVSSAFVVRRQPPRMVVIVVPTLLLALTIGAGCRHRRNALRPVYAVPAAPVVTSPAPVPAAEEPCPAVTAPGFPEASPGALTAPPVTTSPPVAPVAPPASTTEPGLSPSTPGTNGSTPGTNGSTPGTNGSSSAVPPLTVPKETSRRLDRRAPKLARRRELQAQLVPVVNDPVDLFQPPKADRAWRYIVLHHSKTATGGYAQIDREHRQRLGTAGCGYHFVIGNGTDSPDGQIEVAQRWSDQKPGAHCRNARTPDVNDYGIGICLVGDLDRAPPTAKQIESARALVAYLRERYNIPAERVGTHAVLAQGPTACPGKNFPVQAILGTSSVALR
ncbi:MAG: N-acetylmuramoyl-L-alanine amidase [Isosphaeraceae bacterium]|nr:N-acetylmuramoyl-L-alanine amidase [Isosphaeraceae bacterium]